MEEGRNSTECGIRWEGGAEDYRASAGAVAENSKLIIETLPIRVHCTTCGADSDATANRLVCGFCGDWQTQLISGDDHRGRGRDRGPVLLRWLHAHRRWSLQSAGSGQPAGDCRQR